MAPSLTLAAEEAAALVGTATVSTAALAGEFGSIPIVGRILALFALAFTGYLGYSAYKTPAPAAASGAPPA